VYGTKVDGVEVGIISAGIIGYPEGVVDDNRGTGNRYAFADAVKLDSKLLI
jgi:hypothetical protein